VLTRDILLTKRDPDFVAIERELREAAFSPESL